MTVWGGWSGPVTNQFRVGIDLSRSGGTVTATYRVECTQAISQGITLNRSGALTGSVGFQMSHGSSGGVTTVGSYTRSINAGQTLTFGASVSGIYNGASPSVSGVSISRPSDAPTTPSAPGMPRIDDVTSTSVTATFEPPASDGGAPIINHQYQISTNSSHTQQVAAPQFTGGRTYTQGGLTPGTQYWIRARVQNSAGWGDWSNSRTFTTPLRGPAAPSNVQASRVSDSQTRITWSVHGSSTAPYESLQLQRRYVQENGSWSDWYVRVNLSNPNTTAYTDSTTGNWRYQFRVRARNSSGWSAFGESNSIDTTPLEPASVRAQATPSGNRITWTNRARMPASTRIERQEGTGAWTHLMTRGNGWDEAVHTNPDIAVTHRYRVRHENQGTPELASEWAYSNRLELASPPAAPTILGPLNAVDADVQVAIPYLHNATDGSEQTARQMRWRYQGDTAWDEQPEESTSSGVYYVPGGFFENERTVEVQMRTWGMHPDPSPWSSTRRFQTSSPPTVAINTPTTDEVVDTSTLDVTWGYAQASDSVQTAWRLRLYRGESLEVSRDGTGDTSHVTITNLQNSASYLLEVEARSAAGLWSEADTVEFTTDFLPPPTPTIRDVAWDPELGAAVLDIDAGESSEEPQVHRRNLVTNPSFEVDTLGWSTSIGAAIDKVGGPGQGRAELRRTSTVGTGMFAEVSTPVPAGRWLGFAATVESDDVPDASVDLRISSPFGELPVVPSTSVQGGTRLTGAVQVPADAEGMGDFLIRTSTKTVGDTLRIADVIVVEADTQTAALAAVADFFDGDTPNTEGLSYEWEGDPHNSTSVEMDPRTAEVDHLQVWRAIDDGPWLLIADQVPVDTAVTDPIPTIGDGTLNYYRVTSVTALPSTADSAVVPLTVTARMARGWVYLNAGPGMATVCRVRANTTRSDSEGREYVQRVFAGRTSPVAFSGTFVPLEWDVSARIAPDYDGESTRNELVAMQVDYGDQVCYRDPLGHGRWFGAMSQLNFSWERITGEVSWSMSRVEFREGVAPAVEVGA